MTKLGRTRSGRPGNSPERSFDGLLRSPSNLFRLILHLLVCIAGLILGFRLSREALLVVVSFKPPSGTLLERSFTRFHSGESLGEGGELALRFPYVSKHGQGSTPLPEQLQGGIPSSVGIKSSRVHVGRHEILIRPWPHPDPVQTNVAHRLMDLVQHEQRRSYGLKERRRLLVITPTYVRTFQAVHLTGLIHTLRIVPGPLIWIVIEASGVSNETSALLSSSQLPFYHLGIQEAMPASWEERQDLETRMRVEGLRFIREMRLDGIVVFADDSNTYSLEFFDEVQRVNWIGTFSVGVLPHSDLPTSSKEESEVKQGELFTGGEENRRSSQSLPLQGPACNSTGHIAGWYASSADEMYRATKETRSTRSLKWAGFVLNARLLWEDNEKPTWIRNWEDWVGQNSTSVQSPLDATKNEALVEPLGNCGRDVLMWWLRVEARADSKFPSRWLIDPPLEIVVPSKRTPWPDPPVAYPPPPPAPLSSDISNQHEKRKGKQAARGTRGKQRTHHTEKRKQDLAHGKIETQQAAQILGDRTNK